MSFGSFGRALNPRSRRFGSKRLGSDGPWVVTGGASFGVLFSCSCASVLGSTLRRRELEYIRRGTQSLIASFEVATGKVFGHCGPTRTGDDLEAFMDDLAAAYPRGNIHVIWDNLNIHRAMRSRWDAFNERHGDRFHFHFTPLHASWVNQVELWFGILARRCLRNASFQSAEGLRQAVLGFIDEWNVDAHPFRWTFTGYPLQVGE